MFNRSKFTYLQQKIDKLAVQIQCLDNNHEWEYNYDFDYDSSVQGIYKREYVRCKHCYKRHANLTSEAK